VSRCGITTVLRKPRSIPRRAVAAGSETPSIGRLFANTKGYILDRNMQPVPIGVPGELYLGGDGLAAIPESPRSDSGAVLANPFSDDPRTHLQEGTWPAGLPDGEIKYLGRIDHQVKIRGFRIELGEIEAVLNQHPAVQRSVVVVARTHPQTNGWWHTV